jgi:hypothetical protein
MGLMGFAGPLLDFLELELELLLLLLFFSGWSSLCSASIFRTAVNETISSSSIVVCGGGERQGLAMGVQSESFSSKTSGNKSSSDIKLVGSCATAPLSDDRRGHEGYAHDEP